MASSDQPNGQEMAMLLQGIRQMQTLQSDMLTLKKEVSDLKAENEAFRSTIRELTDENRQLKSTISELLAELNANKDNPVINVEEEEEGEIDPAVQADQDAIHQRIMNEGNDPTQRNSILKDILELVKKHKETILVGVVGGAIGALLVSYGVPLVLGAAVCSTKVVASGAVVVGGSAALFYDVYDQERCQEARLN